MEIQISKPEISPEVRDAIFQLIDADKIENFEHAFEEFFNSWIIGTEACKEEKASALFHYQSVRKFLVSVRSTM